MKNMAPRDAILRSVVGVLSAAWFSGMFALHGDLWLPWLCFFAALALTTVLLLRRGDP
ncbi:MAG: hypothetical protein NVSMB22_23010 [Chloroflexota bacterium]